MMVPIICVVKFEGQPCTRDSTGNGVLTAYHVNGHGASGASKCRQGSSVSTSKNGYDYERLCYSNNANPKPYITTI